jgi:hypothetical protein
MHGDNVACNFHVDAMRLDIIKVFYSPTDAQVNCLKNNFKIYIKIDIKTAPASFSAVTPSSGSTLLMVAKVTVVYFGTVQCTHTNKDPLIYEATSHTDVF